MDNKFYDDEYGYFSGSKATEGRWFGGEPVSLKLLKILHRKTKRFPRLLRGCLHEILFQAKLIGFLRLYHFNEIKF